MSISRITHNPLARDVFKDRIVLLDLPGKWLNVRTTSGAAPTRFRGLNRFGIVPTRNVSVAVMDDLLR